MVRSSSTLDRGPQSSGHASDFQLVAQAAVQYPGGHDRRPAPWRGVGGRWAIWVLQARGLGGPDHHRRPRRDGDRAQPENTAARGRHVRDHWDEGLGWATAADSCPSGLAGAYALQFASVYLNFSQGTASQRAQELAAFLPNGSDPQLGWNGAGSLKLQSDQVAGISVRDAQHAVVTLLAKVNGQMMELGVPIYASGSGMVVNGQPAWVAAPTRVSPPAPAAASPDTAAQNALQAQLPTFFQAYASGEPATLTRFLVPGVNITGLGGAVTYSSIASPYVPPGGDTRQITVSVVWQIPGPGGASPAQLPMTYDMTVVRQNSDCIMVIHATDVGAALDRCHLAIRGSLALAVIETWVDNTRIESGTTRFQQASEAPRR
jgi:Conjugative transposon protein TcpC